MKGYVITTDRARIDVAAVHGYLSRESYWAQAVPLAVVQKSIENSLCFAILGPGETELAGFARVITDYATFGYLADVFVLPAHRGKGLSKWLVETIVSHPDLQGLRRWMLATRDAHSLYERYGGFSRVTALDRWMERHNPNVYKEANSA
jgi:GNAT superfamily N-acetyltransferase